MYQKWLDEMPKDAKQIFLKAAFGQYVTKFIFFDKVKEFVQDEMIKCARKYIKTEDFKGKVKAKADGSIEGSIENATKFIVNEFFRRLVIGEDEDD